MLASDSPLAGMHVQVAPTTRAVYTSELLYFEQKLFSMVFFLDSICPHKQENTTLGRAHTSSKDSVFIFSGHLCTYVRTYVYHCVTSVPQACPPENPEKGCSKFLSENSPSRASYQIQLTTCVHQFDIRTCTAQSCSEFLSSACRACAIIKNCYHDPQVIQFVHTWSWSLAL